MLVRSGHGKVLSREILMWNIKALILTVQRLLARLKIQRGGQNDNDRQDRNNMTPIFNIYSDCYFGSLDFENSNPIPNFFYFTIYRIIHGKICITPRIIPRLQYLSKDRESQGWYRPRVFIGWPTACWYPNATQEKITYFLFNLLAYSLSGVKIFNNFAV